MDIEAQLAAIGGLGAMFEGERIEYWIFGGWVVDFHAGRVTREHADIDIAVWIIDLPAVHTSLLTDGWTHSPAAEDDGYTTYSRDGLRLDLALLARDERFTRSPHMRLER